MWNTLYNILIYVLCLNFLYSTLIYLCFHLALVTFYIKSMLLPCLEFYIWNIMQKQWTKTCSVWGRHKTTLDICHLRISSETAGCNIRTILPSPIWRRYLNFASPNRKQLSPGCNTRRKFTFANLAKVLPNKIYLALAIWRVLMLYLETWVTMGFISFRPLPSSSSFNLEKKGYFLPIKK